MADQTDQRDALPTIGNPDNPGATSASGKNSADRWLYLDLLMPESLLDAIGERARQRGEVFNEFIGHAIAVYLDHPQSSEQATADTSANTSADTSANAPVGADDASPTIRRPIALREMDGERLVAAAQAYGLAADTLLLRILHGAVASA